MAKLIVNLEELIELCEEWAEGEEACEEVEVVIDEERNELLLFGIEEGGKIAPETYLKGKR